MKVIITGSTGMIGKGVLYECLDEAKIEKTLIINRSNLGVNHTKLKEIIHKDFSDFNPIKEHLKDYDVCFHCMGVSSMGMSEEKYSQLTYNISAQLADTLYELNPEMTFIYVSGTGTDSSEKGKVMWARVKGKTENYILNKGFKDAYMFRPGAIIPEKGIKSKTTLYRVLYVIMTPFFPLLKKSKNITTTSKIGKAMINTVLKGSSKKYLENIDINKLAE